MGGYHFTRVFGIENGMRRLLMSGDHDGELDVSGAPRARAGALKRWLPLAETSGFSNATVLRHNRSINERLRARKERAKRQAEKRREATVVRDARPTPPLSTFKVEMAPVRSALVEPLKELSGVLAHKRNLEELTGRTLELYTKLYDAAVEQQRERKGR